jgi:hypothetical protein
MNPEGRLLADDHILTGTDAGAREEGRAPHGPLVDQGPTPTLSDLPLRRADFASLAEALDYAAQGSTGCNFYGLSGELNARRPYAELRRRALAADGRLDGQIELHASWRRASRALEALLERRIGGKAVLRVD